MKFGFVNVAAAVPTVKVADVEYNVQQIESLIAQAEESGVEVMVFPELCITGYSCQDLFKEQLLLDHAEDGVVKLLDFTRKLNVIVIVGLPVVVNGLLYNCAAVLQGGQLLGIGSGPESYRDLFCRQPRSRISRASGVCYCRWREVRCRDLRGCMGTHTTKQQLGFGWCRCDLQPLGQRRADW